MHKVAAVHFLVAWTLSLTQVDLKGVFPRFIDECKIKEYTNLWRESEIVIEQLSELHDHRGDADGAAVIAGMDVHANLFLIDWRLC